MGDGRSELRDRRADGSPGTPWLVPALLAVGAALLVGGAALWLRQSRGG